MNLQQEIQDFSIYVSELLDSSKLPHSFSKRLFNCFSKQTLLVTALILVWPYYILLKLKVYTAHFEGWQLLNSTRLQKIPRTCLVSRQLQFFKVVVVVHTNVDWVFIYKGRPTDSVMQTDTGCISLRLTIMMCLRIVPNFYLSSYKNIIHDLNAKTIRLKQNCLRFFCVILIRSTDGIRVKVRKRNAEDLAAIVNSGFFYLCSESKMMLLLVCFLRRVNLFIDGKKIPFTGFLL